MEKLASKLQGTGQVFAKKGDLLVSRTRAAGQTFLGEVAEAGDDLLNAFRAEARSWKRFLAQRSGRFQLDATSLFAPEAFERELLSRVDGTLRSLDARVRRRLVALDGSRAKATRQRTGSKARTRRATRSSRKPPTAIAGASASAAH